MSRTHNWFNKCVTNSEDIKYFAKDVYLWKQTSLAKEYKSYWQKRVCLIRRPSRFRNIRDLSLILHVVLLCCGSLCCVAGRCVVLQVVVLCCGSLCCVAGRCVVLQVFVLCCRCVAGLSLVANQRTKTCLEACLPRPTDINHNLREFFGVRNIHLDDKGGSAGLRTDPRTTNLLWDTTRQKKTFLVLYMSS